MIYNYKILICKNGEWCEMGAQCQDVRVVTDMINEQFGYQIVTRDSVYNYLQRPHVSNKRVFNKQSHSRSGIPSNNQCSRSILFSSSSDFT